MAQIGGGFLFLRSPDQWFSHLSLPHPYSFPLSKVDLEVFSLGFLWICCSGFAGCWEILEDLGRIDLVVMLCWLLGFMDFIAGDMGLVEIWVWGLVLCSRD